MSVLLRLLSRYRRLVILTTALVLSFLLMTLQVRHETAVVTYTREALLLMVSPFIKVTSATIRGVTGTWRDYVDLRALREENKRLQLETTTLKRRLDQLQEQALETHLKVRVADDPLSCVVLGTGKVLDELDLLKTVCLET